MINLLTNHTQTSVLPRGGVDAAGCSSQTLRHGADCGPAAVPGGESAPDASVNDPGGRYNACVGAGVVQAAGEAPPRTGGDCSDLQAGCGPTLEGAAAADEAPRAAAETPADAAAGAVPTAAQRPAAVNTQKHASQDRDVGSADAAAAGAAEGGLKRRLCASRERSPPAAAEGGKVVGYVEYSDGLSEPETGSECKVIRIE